MGLLSIEHSRTAYVADLALYALAVVLLAGLLMVAAPAREAPALVGLVLAGVAAWTVMEYVVHRFILHGLQPFRRWHALHHAKPLALVGAPTVLSATLIVGLVAAPAWWLADGWQALALVLGVVAGYLGYGLVHHAIHHVRADLAWLKHLKRWHALHHAPGAPPRCYGVTSGFWDRVFGTAT